MGHRKKGGEKGEELSNVVDHIIVFFFGIKISSVAIHIRVNRKIDHFILISDKVCSFSPI